MKTIFRSLIFAFILPLALQAAINDFGSWDGNLPDCQDKIYQVNLNHQVLDASTIIQTLGGFTGNSWLVPRGYPLFFSGRPLIGVALVVKNLENLAWPDLQRKIESMMGDLKDRPGIMVECASVDTSTN